MERQERGGGKGGHATWGTKRPKISVSATIWTFVQDDTRELKNTLGTLSQLSQFSWTL